MSRTAAPTGSAVAADDELVSGDAVATARALDEAVGFNRPLAEVG